MLFKLLYYVSYTIGMHVYAQGTFVPMVQHDVSDYYLNRLH